MRLSHVSQFVLLHNVSFDVSKQAASTHAAVVVLLAVFAVCHHVLHLDEHTRRRAFFPIDRRRYWMICAHAVDKRQAIIRWQATQHKRHRNTSFSDGNRSHHSANCSMAINFPQTPNNCLINIWLLLAKVHHNSMAFYCISRFIAHCVCVSGWNCNHQNEHFYAQSRLMNNTLRAQRKMRFGYGTSADKWQSIRRRTMLFIGYTLSLSLFFFLSLPIDAHQFYRRRNTFGMMNFHSHSVVGSPHIPKLRHCCCCIVSPWPLVCSSSLACGCSASCTNVWWAYRRMTFRHRQTTVTFNNFVSATLSRLGRIICFANPVYEAWAWASLFMSAIMLDDAERRGIHSLGYYKMSCIHSVIQIHDNTMASKYSLWDFSHAIC